MILEHNTYKEAMSDIKLSEEVGMEMIKNAMEMKKQRSQKIRAKMAAVAAALVVVFLGANGICFAATGMSAWGLFQSLYQGTGEDAKLIAEDFRESGETLTYGNTQYTLENYWYDKDNGLLYFTLRSETLDGKPVDVSEDAYQIYPAANDYFAPGGGMTVGHGESVISDNGTVMTRYYYASRAERDEAQENSILRNEEISKDALLCQLSVKDGGLNEHGYPSYKEIGSFVMEPTGKTKSLELDCSALESCSGITLNGGAMNLFFDDAFGEDYDKPEPFGMIEFRMKDGTSTYLVNELPEGDWETIADKDGTILGFKSDEMDLSKDRYLGGFALGIGNNFENGGWYESEYMSHFLRFIDVDEIEAVYADGAELPIVK